MNQFFSATLAVINQMKIHKNQWPKIVNTTSLPPAVLRIYITLIDTYAVSRKQTA
jgi:hypothetical protein